MILIAYLLSLCAALIPTQHRGCCLPPPKENKQTRQTKNIYSLPHWSGGEVSWCNSLGQENSGKGHQVMWCPHTSLPAAPTEACGGSSPSGVKGLTPVPFQTAPIAHTEHQPSVWKMSQAQECVRIHHYSRCKKDTEGKGMSQCMLVLWLCFPQ